MTNKEVVNSLKCCGEYGDRCAWCDMDGCGDPQIGCIGTLMCIAADRMEQLMVGLPRVPWVPVSDRPPIPMEPVLVFRRGAGDFIETYCDVRGFSGDPLWPDNPVTHWMECPGDPVEDGAEFGAIGGTDE